MWTNVLVKETFALFENISILYEEKKVNVTIFIHYINNIIYNLYLYIYVFIDDDDMQVDHSDVTVSTPKWL